MKILCPHFFFFFSQKARCIVAKIMTMLEKKIINILVQLMNLVTGSKKVEFIGILIYFLSEAAVEIKILAFTKLKPVY